MSQNKDIPQTPKPEKKPLLSKSNIVGGLATLGVAISSLQLGGGLLNTIPSLDNLDNTGRVNPEEIKQADSMQDYIGPVMSYYGLDSEKTTDVDKFSIKLLTLQSKLTNLQTAVATKNANEIKLYALTDQDKNDIRTIIKDPNLTPQAFDQFFAFTDSLINTASELQDLTDTIEEKEAALAGVYDTMKAIGFGIAGLLGSISSARSNKENS
jgi:hypothetical protein